MEYIYVIYTFSSVIYTKEGQEGSLENGARIIPKQREERREERQVGKEENRTKRKKNERGW